MAQHDTPPSHPTPSAPPSPLADSRLTSMGLLFETYAGVRAAVEADLVEHGMTSSEFEVLVRLARSPDQQLRMSVLAEQSTLSNSGLTRVVDRLLDGGFVRRVRHEQDRRVFHAVLTPAGERQLLRVLPSHVEVIDRTLTQVLSPDELQAFTHALRTIRRVVKPGSDPEHHLAV